MYACMYVCTRRFICVYWYTVYMYICMCYTIVFGHIDIYIYIYAGDYCRSPVDDSPRLPFKMKKITCSKKARNWKRPFFEARWLVQPGQTLWNKCVFWCGYYCSSATVISVQLHDRNTGVASKICTWAKSVILPSPPHPTPPWSP